jgi:spore germination protein YaaH
MKRRVFIDALVWASTNSSGRPVVDAPTPWLPQIYEGCVSVFVFRVDSNANIIQHPSAVSGLDTRFRDAVHAGGEKAIFSLFGGGQDPSLAHQVVQNKGTTLINNIANKIAQQGWDGVCIDYENDPTPDPNLMPDFINALRTRLNQVRPGLLLIADMQPRAFNNVWQNLRRCEPSFDWIQVMLYDNPNWTNLDLRVRLNEYVPYMNNRKDKVVMGLSVASTSRPTMSPSGLDTEIKWVKANGFGGIEIWNNTQMTDSHWQVIRNNWGAI